MSDTTSLIDVVADTVAALDMYEGLFGGGSTHIERVTEDWTGKDEVVVFLDNGDVYTLCARQLPAYAAKQARGL